MGAAVLQLRPAVAPAFVPAGPAPMPSAVRERLQSTRDALARGMGATAWAAMPLPTRTVLVMLSATDAQGDPRHLAAQSWAQFTEGDRRAIGACARDLARGLRDAGKLQA